VALAHLTAFATHGMEHRGHLFHGILARDQLHKVRLAAVCIRVFDNARQAVYVGYQKADKQEEVENLIRVSLIVVRNHILHVRR